MRLMVVTNTTPYTDASLLRLVRIALEVANVPSRRFELLHVRFLTCAGEHFSGHASLGMPGQVRPRGKYMLRLPRQKPTDPEDFNLTVTQRRYELIAVAVHEAMHIRGAKHADMTPEQRHCCGPPHPRFEGWELRYKAAEPKPDPAELTAALKKKRLEHAQKMHAKSVTRRKRAQTIEKKWAERMRRLERNQK